MKDINKEYDINFFVSLDRKFNEMMNKSRGIREFVQKEHSDKTDAEQMDIYRALFTESMKEEDPAIE